MNLLKRAGAALGVVRPSAPADPLSSPADVPEEAASPEIETPEQARARWIAIFKQWGEPKGIKVDYIPNQVIKVSKNNRQFLLSPDHLFYAGDLVNQFDYYFSSTIPDLIDGVEQVDYTRPRWHNLRSGDRMYYTSLAEDLGATEDYLKYLHPSEGETVLDVGAYCGLSVLHFSRAVGNRGRVIAFEPDPRNYESLKTNVEAAGVQNVTIEHKAMSGTAGALLFSSEGNMGSALISTVTDRGKGISVESTTLLDVVQRHNLTKVGAIKIDIEGAEYGVLESSTDLIAGLGARWAIELHADPVNGTPVEVERVRKIFDALGYFTYLQLGSEVAAAPTIFAYPGP